MEQRPETLTEWLDRGWNGHTDPINPDLAERLECRRLMLVWLKENYPKFRAQQKRRVKGQGELFE